MHAFPFKWYRMSTTSKCPENANVDENGACQCNDGYITATCDESK